jgi:hypothetical protein
MSSKLVRGYTCTKAGEPLQWMEYQLNELRQDEVTTK